MRIKALDTFPGGILDLSAMNRLQETNPLEHEVFTLYIRPNQVVEVDDKYFSLQRIKEALSLGWIQIGDLPNQHRQLIDGTFSGTTLELIAGEDLSATDLVYFHDSGRVFKARADSRATMPVMGMNTDDVTSLQRTNILLDGLIRNSSIFSFTVGGQASSPTAIVWASNLTFGAVTQTQPVTSTHIVQQMGHAVTNDILHFQLDRTFIELS